MPRTVPASATEAVGFFQTAALWNAQVKATTDFLATVGVPRFFGYATSTQSIPDGSGLNTVIALDSEVVDSDGGHSTSTNTSRYTCQVAGTYVALGTLSYTANATGGRSLLFLVNNANVRGSAVQVAPLSGFSTCMQVFTVVQMAVGDYIELDTWQSSGGALSTSVNTKFGPSMALWWIGP